MAMSTYRLIIFAIILNAVIFTTLGKGLNFKQIGDTSPTPDTVFNVIKAGKLNESIAGAKEELNSENKKTTSQLGDVVSGAIGNVVGAWNFVKELFFDVFLGDIERDIARNLHETEYIEKAILIILGIFRGLVNIIMVIDLIMFVYSKKVS